ncbi:MAG: 4Fe-4S binding protein [Thermodesulfobacteriota bacterium]
MRIVTVRRLSQGFFLLLFMWFCVAATVGPAWWQMRGWPINWFLSLDPLTALSTALATGTLYSNMLWSLAVVVLTAALGRFFCGFVCPMGTLNHLTGWASRRTLDRMDRVQANAHGSQQSIKYLILAFFLACAASGSVQTGLLDPLPLLHRSVNLTLLPLADAGHTVLSDEPRAYESAWLIGAVLWAVLGLNLVRPRFFCRFLCPLGALFALTARYAPWRVGKSDPGKCGDCRMCEEYCEGGCRPSGEIIHGECVLCCNCLDRCPSGRMGYGTAPSAAGETPLPDISRRGAVVALAAGAFAAPLWGVGALAGSNRSALLIRPPGSLDEERFLTRCIRCGQCMRACPSNIIQPSLFEAGVQGLWTPALNFRIGRSGCQPNCIACGQVCPTAAIRPLSLEEKHGVGPFAEAGPVRLGTAFVDRSRCLPWVMDRPCIVCQELCPVSPKAIFTRTVFEPVRDGRLGVVRVLPGSIDLAAIPALPVNLGSGDYAVRPASSPAAPPRRILGRDGARLILDRQPSGRPDVAAGDRVEIVVKLQRPFVDPSRCIGCGMCEHECPVSGLRAIRVYSENETRTRLGRMTI